MHPRNFALWGGLIMLVLGVLALIPGLSSYPVTLPPLVLEASYGLFLGVFAMNVLNKLALIILGVAGLVAAFAKNTSLPASISYSRWVFAIMGVLAILGLFPGTNTLGGYWPLFGHEVWFHALIALVGAYFGFALSMKVRDQGPAMGGV